MELLLPTLPRNPLNPQLFSSSLAYLNLMYLYSSLLISPFLFPFPLLSSPSYLPLNLSTYSFSFIPLLFLPSTRLPFGYRFNWHASPHVSTRKYLRYHSALKLNAVFLLKVGPMVSSLSIMWEFVRRQHLGPTQTS